MRLEGGCWNFKPHLMHLHYSYALVAYFSYTPVQLYSANLIFGFIGGADLACVLDSTAVSGAGLDRVLDWWRRSRLCSRFCSYWWRKSNHGC